MSASVIWPEELLVELRKEWPDPALVRLSILRTYEKALSVELSAEPSRSELDQVVRWLNQVGVDLASSFLKWRRVRVPVFSNSLSGKIASLAQFHCPLCETANGPFPVEIIPIRISPVSKQAIGRTPIRRAAFERAIRYRFSGRDRSFTNDKSICLLVVFVVKSTSRPKDLDNMAKAIVDAVKNVLFGDDGRIDHLNILRIKARDEEYVYLNIRETRINEHLDVLSPHQHHSWAGAEPLDLEEFL